MSWHSLGCYHVTFSCKCSDWGRWFSRLVHMGAEAWGSPGISPTLCWCRLVSLPWHLWPWPEDDLFCPCHASVLNTNAMVLCAPPLMGTSSAIFSHMSPAAHLQPGANGQLVFVSHGRRQCRNLPNTNRHLDTGRLCPAPFPCQKAQLLKPCSPFNPLQPS